MWLSDTLTTHSCTNGTSACNNGQSCFWFSQGCTIGCKSCDGNGSRIPNFDHCPDISIAPTINEPKYRTVNQAAPAGSHQDFTKYHPWRAPGKAPVWDACGMAGGVQTEVFNGESPCFLTHVQPGHITRRSLLSKVILGAKFCHGGLLEQCGTAELLSSPDGKTQQSMVEGD